jgi:hypothetical protein
VYKSSGRAFWGLIGLIGYAGGGFLLSIYFDFFEKSYEIFFIESPAFTAFFL